MTNDEPTGGTTEYVPPPAVGSGAPAADQRPRPYVKAITVTLAVVGGLTLLGVAGAGALTAMQGTAVPREDSTQTAATAGVSSLVVDADSGDMTIEFDDVATAQLTVTNGRRSEWTLERSGSDLIVQKSTWGFDGWFDGNERIRLVLPESLNDGSLDASLDLTAGSLDVDGDFDELEIDMTAGSLALAGSATSFNMDISAGSADVLLDSVSTAALQASAGDTDVEFTGAAPTATTIDVTAGSLDVTMPDDSYDVRQDVTVGDLTNELDVSSASRRFIDVSLTAGSVTLSPEK